MASLSDSYDVLHAALSESGIEKKEDKSTLNANYSKPSENLDQVDLFSQALFMLDESNREIEDRTETSSPALNKDSSNSVETPKAQVLKKQDVGRISPSSLQSAEKISALPTRTQIPAYSDHQSLVVLQNGQAKPIVYVKSLINDNKRELGLVRNGSAPVLGNPFLIQNNGLPHVLSSRDVSKLWSNDDIRVKNLTPLMANENQKLPDEEEEAEEEEEDLGVAETYSNYMPTKLKIGIRHPDPVVETSSLSAVEPPDVRYNVNFPEKIIEDGSLSALQLEAVTYACQRHETKLPSGERAGFLIGDGAGVGKGRTIAGIIYENYIVGRKRSIWLSVSNDLKEDAERDLGDIGAGKIPVQALNKLKYGKISSHENGTIKKGVIFATYSSLIGESTASGKYKTRMKMLLNWCGSDFDGVIVFDECHKAKNLCPTGSSKPTKTGLAVVELQQKLPAARVVYASATGASEPKNMAYMTRLGLWGPGMPFREFSQFIQAIEKRGVGAMELVAMDMKLRGMYIARQLSFQGVSFKIEDIPVPKDFIKVYNAAVKLWVDARAKFAEAADLIDAERQMRKSMWGQFWSCHQRFFKYLCISAKVPYAVKIAKEALKQGKCVVIGLQSTGEARTLEQLEEMGGELSDFVSTAKGVLQTLLEKHFPAPDRQKAFDLFGLEGKTSIFDELDLKNILENTKVKRQASQRSGRGSTNGPSRDSAAQVKDASSTEEESDSEESSEEENVSQEETEETNGDESEDEDDFNPFGGSDSDDDPWIKKSKAKSVPVKRKKLPKPKKAKKPKKEKKEKNHKPAAKVSKAAISKRDNSDNSSDYSDIDDILDNVLGKVAVKQPRSTTPTNTGADKKAVSIASEKGAGLTAAEARERATKYKQELLAGLDQLGDKLPANTLDELINSLGGTDDVAEMTGRKGRVVSDATGAISYELRSAQDVPLEYLNLVEKKRFMDGEKLVAIISEAASSGISLQADRRASNQRRRLHITLELPWSADRAIQQFGRTHRSNQVSAPEYMFLISELAGERRFASTVAKRLECLGALTHGDRRATESRDLSQFNVDNKYGRAALEIVMKTIVKLDRPLVPPPADYSGSFFADAQHALVGVGLISFDNRHNIPILEKDYSVISKFLNRILGIEVALQNALFQYFTDTLNAVILQAKRNGRWDLGILDLGAGSENVKVLNRRVFESQYGGSSAKTELVTVSVERGLDWESAMNLWRDHVGSDDGFYVSNVLRQGKKSAFLAVASAGGKKKERLYQIYRPNTGLAPRMESLAIIKKKAKKVDPDACEDIWLDQYEQSAQMCTHAFWRGQCRRVSMGMKCEIGLRTRTYTVLTGSVLSVWNKVEMVIASQPGGPQNKMQVIRLRTDNGKRIVGTLIPINSVQALTDVLLQKDTPPNQPSHSFVAGVP